MAFSKRVSAFDPHAPTRQLVTDGESPRFALATALYRFYDIGQHLLHIGFTGQPRERWVKHRRTAGWWHTTAYVAVEIYPTEWQALHSDRAAIRSERPRFNDRSNKGGS